MNLRMRIVQTPARFYPYSGGVESYVHDLSRELVKLGHEVSVICADESGVGDGVIDGVRVKRLSYIGKIANTNITPELPYELWKEKFDIIHTHLPTPWSADWSAIVSKMKKRLLVVTYHNDIMGFGVAGYIAQLYNKTMLKLVLGKADKIIVTNKKQLSSPFLRDYAEKIMVIPSGIDTEKFRPVKANKQKNSIFFLSVLDRYHRYKGLDYLLSALKIVKEEVRDVKLIVGGGGELLTHYREMASSLGLKNNVKFVGYIPQDEIIGYYNGSELFVLPSTSQAQEGFGIVLLEAMACGLPIVATDIVGMADEIEKNKAGVVVRPREIDSLADAILASLKNNKGGVNARKLAQKYDWGVITTRISKIYSSLS